MDRFEAGWLNDFYGPLLTEHRQQVLGLYLEEDMSLSEIAQETGISRQGVHDAIRKAENQLESYEEKLGLLARYRQIQSAVDQCRMSLKKVIPAGEGAAALKEALRALDQIERIER